MENQDDWQKYPRTERRSLLEAVVALVAFYALSLLSRFVLPVFVLVVGAGLSFPLIWGLVARDWERMGFTPQNIRPALLWGLGSGALLTVVVWFTTAHRLAPFFALQLIVGIPIGAAPAA